MNARKSSAAVAVLIVTVAAMLLSSHSSVMAGKFNRVLSVGDKAPRFEGLVGVDDKSHGFDNYKDAKVIVLCFTCNSCPIALMYEDRFIDFAKAYKDKPVRFVAVNVNNIPADGLDKMKERAERKGFGFDYLYDPTQKIGRDYGATVTPHLFVIDKERRIAYMGAFDDDFVGDDVEKHYVRDAVDALLDGKRPEITESLQRGCNIKYD